MRNQTKYLFIYLFVLCILIGGVVNLAQAENTNSSAADISQNKLTEAKLEQVLAPIALYPDTLLSHILVASTYPLELVQAARWRKNHKTLNEQQTLDAAEEKDWDPSIKALSPFNDLLQTLTDDLDWLQSLGDAFLFDEETVLASLQSLRQKAYAQGNLSDNQYMEVEKNQNEIIIQTVEKEVVYIPYYDTRSVYGNWWWNDHPPHYWHSPSHYIWNAGVYWSSRFFIRPSFYYSGFKWSNRHVVTNYSYRTHRDNQHWSHSHTRKQKIRVTEFPRWTHDQTHRRGVHYTQNGKRIIRNSENPNRYISTNNSPFSKKTQQIDKQRVLNLHNYPINRPSSHTQIKRKLTTYNQTSNINKAHKTKQLRLNRDTAHKIIKPRETRQLNSGKWQKQSRTRSTENSPKQVSSRSTPTHSKIQNRTSGQKTNKSRPVRSKSERNHRDKR
ncbi:DUF3300 domain-containing protein [Paraglaciecola sp. L3A3]|uniref:DUF3300 domain-containing protein n=1 Tax=Paraglaciecola sp. L3A3 TaxID=2686358 RepID=UPI00131AC002|nr:DUF3300 domain-containing protein [Paraglaciecola sp. L3A3]